MVGPVVALPERRAFNYCRSPPTPPLDKGSCRGSPVAISSSVQTDLRVNTKGRLGGIYGPKHTRLLERVRSGQATYRKGGPFYTNRIHRDDCAGALQHLMELDSPGPLYLGVDEEPAEEQAVLQWMAGALGAPDPRPRPEGGSARGTAGRPPSNKRCKGDRLRESGYAFTYPTFREGYTALIKELGLVS